LGILPPDFYNGTIISNSKNNNSTNLPLLRDYLIDLDTGYLIKSDSGQFTIVTGLQAIITQVWRKLHTPKGKYEMFSSKYGNTFDELKGKGKSYGDAYAYTKLQSALVDNKYIKSVDNVTLKLEKDKYTITFTLNTFYGNTSTKIDIPLED
jgi:hypothetical protein